MIWAPQWGELVFKNGMSSKHETNFAELTCSHADRLKERTLSPRSRRYLLLFKDWCRFKYSCRIKRHTDATTFFWEEKVPRGSHSRSSRHESFLDPNPELSDSWGMRCTFNGWVTSCPMETSYFCSCGQTDSMLYSSRRSQHGVLSICGRLTVWLIDCPDCPLIPLPGCYRGEGGLMIISLVLVTSRWSWFSSHDIDQDRTVVWVFQVCGSGWRAGEEKRTGHTTWWSSAVGLCLGVKETDVSCRSRWKKLSNLLINKLCAQHSWRTSCFHQWAAKEFPVHFPLWQ